MVVRDAGASGRTICTGVRASLGPRTLGAWLRNESSLAATGALPAGWASDGNASAMRRHETCSQRAERVSVITVHAVRTINAVLLAALRIGAWRTVLHDRLIGEWALEALGAPVTRHVASCGEGSRSARLSRASAAACEASGTGHAISDANWREEAGRTLVEALAVFRVASLACRTVSARHAAEVAVLAGAALNGRA